MNYCLLLSSSLLSILVEEFHLNVEGFATPLSHSNEFQYWCSESAADQEFGALGSFFSYDLSGKNTFGFIQEMIQLRLAL